MALASYPAGLGTMVRDAYQLASPYPDAEVTEMEDGPERMRSRASATWSTVPIGIVMTTEEFDVFHDFAVRVLDKGTAHFNMPIGRFDTPNTPMKRVYIVGGKYDAKPQAVGYVMVSFTLKVLNW